MKNDTNIVKDSVQTLAMRVLNMVVAAALGILTARLLGPNQRGLYVLPGLDVNLAAAFFTGLGNATSYYMLNERRGSGVLRPALLTTPLFVIAGILGVAILGIAEHRPWTILPAVIVLLPTAVVLVVTSYCYGLHRVRYANYFGILGSLSGLIFMVIGLLLIAKSAAIAIDMWIASTTLTAIVAAIFFWNTSRRLECSPVSVRAYTIFAIKGGLTNLVSILNLRIDVYIIAALTSPATLGIYTVAVVGAEALKILTMVLSQTAAPRIGSAPQAESARFTAKCIRHNLLIALIPCAIMIVAAPWLLGVLYGAKFLPGVSALQILSIGIFASAPASLFAAYYTLKLGRPLMNLWNCAFSATVCLALSFMLIPRMGMNGAAAASTISYAASQALFLWIFSRDTGLPASTVLLVQRDDLVLFQRVAVATLRRVRNVAT